MTFNFTPEQHKQLEALQAQPHFSHRGGDNRNTPAEVVCRLVDVSNSPRKVGTLKSAFAEGRGMGEATALADALKNANPNDRPASPAEQLMQLRQAQEDIALKDAELAELKAALEDGKAATKKKPSSKAAAKTTE